MPNQPLNPSDVSEALLTIADLLDRSPISFLLLNDTGAQVLEHHHNPTPDLNLSHIDIGVQEKHWTQDGSRMLKALMDLQHLDYLWNEAEIRLTIRNVPINIKIFKRKYGFFQNPSRVFFRTQEMSIPNPFDRYFKARFIVR